MNLDSRAMHSRAIEATKLYLERKGYEIIDEAPLEFDFIAEADGVIAFIDVTASTDEFLGKRRARGSVEQAMTNFMRGKELVDRQVRYDVVSLIVTGSFSAMLKHHVDALGKGTTSEHLDEFIANNPNLTEQQIDALRAFVEFID